MSSPLAAQLTQAILAASAGNRAASPFAVGVVTAVSPLTVDWGDSVHEVARLESYTPAVDDVVLMARPSNQLVVLGQII